MGLASGWSGRRASIGLSSLVVVASAALVLWRWTWTPISACEREVRDRHHERAFLICLGTFELTQDQRYLYWAVRSDVYLGKTIEAERLAKRLVLSGASYGDGHELFSYLALRRGDLHAARMHATLAKVAHTLMADERGLTLDAVRFSQAAWRAGDFAAALDAADDALKRAPRLDDPHTETIAYVARADALRLMGDVRAAADTLKAAIARAATPCDKAWVRVKNAICLAETGESGLALAELAVAADENQGCNSKDISAQVMNNQATWLRRRDPAASLALANALTKVEGETAVILLLRAYLAADRGALSESAGYLEGAESIEPPDADWPWEIARARAELAELRGGLLGNVLAEYHYRRATRMVSNLRATAQARSAYLVTSHRGPYDGLIGLLAQQGRWRAVLEVILDLDASDMLRATADELVARGRAAFTLDPPSTAPAAVPALRVTDVLSAWRSRELVILFAPTPRQIGDGREVMYRLRIADGQVTGEAVAEASTARLWAERMFADPGDRAAARALGHVVAPRSASTNPLYVLAIGSLGKAPLAALRDDDDSLLIARRPLVRVLALRAGGPESSGLGPPVVIADARRNLPNAVVEGAVVASTLGADAQVSGSAWPAQATSERLLAARDASLLHVAGHVGVHGRWRALLLDGSEVGPDEIVRHRIAPRVAVLAGCGSAAALDEEGWGSIAAALLEAGTAVVIATDRSVGDAVALTVVQQFYAQPDCRTDPARALARVQQAMDARASTEGAANPRVWAAFSVLARAPEVGAGAAMSARVPPPSVAPSRN